jgi:serine/threonine protein phosphatase PrpC
VLSNNQQNQISSHHLSAVPHVYETTISTEEYCVVGSDGFWETFPVDYVFPSDMDTDALAQAAVDRVKRPDDVTVLAIHLRSRLDELPEGDRVAVNLLSKFQSMNI